MGTRKGQPWVAVVEDDADVRTAAALMALELATPTIVPGAATALAHAATRRFRSEG